MSASPLNSRYAYTEIVKVVTIVEIGHDKPEGRADALRCAIDALTCGECGGAGVDVGCYNAVRLQTPKVKYYKAGDEE